MLPSSDNVFATAEETETKAHPQAAPALSACSHIYEQVLNGMDFPRTGQARKTMLPMDDLDARLIALLEKQKRELVLRFLKKNEEMLAEKVFSDTLLANLSGFFFVTTPGFRLVRANENFLRLAGCSAERLGALSLASFIPADAFTRLKALLAAGEVRNFEAELATTDGGAITVSMNASSLHSAPGGPFFLFIAQDISEVRTMMSRVREAQEQLIHSERLASLGEMAAGIGHELTQPLNALLLYARNCRKCCDEPEMNRAFLSENLEIIIDRAKKASSIIKNLRSFARKEEPVVYPVEVNPILRNILRFLRTQLQLSDVEAVLDLAEALPPALGHEVRLEQVFLNIIQNALQSMGETETPQLLIRTWTERSLDPESLLERDYVVTAIEDNGAGIPPEIIGKIFNPFFTTREVGTGMGLGLSIVDRIVRSCSGFIRVESTPGAGTQFRVYLPAICGGSGATIPEEDPDAAS